MGQRQTGYGRQWVVLRSLVQTHDPIQIHGGHNQPTAGRCRSDSRRRLNLVNRHRNSRSAINDSVLAQKDSLAGSRPSDR